MALAENASSGPGDPVWRPVTLDVGPDAGPESLRALVGDAAADVTDLRENLRAELAEVRAGVSPALREDAGRWVYYPWRRCVLGLLGPEALRVVRLDRNRNKITGEEQRAFGRLRIGVVGLSVGHAVAHTLALEGLCGELRLADFDDLELSNLNRVPGTLFDVGVNKAVVAARRIAEIDPDLEVAVFADGVTAQNVPTFLDGLDILIEECDSLDLKVTLREEARRRRIPVIMETSDRGLLDVERFDLEPDRPLFHGLLGEIESSTLQGLSSRDKVPHILGILGSGALSPRMAASLVDVGRTLSTWPQLGGDVALGGATVAAAVRRLGRGEALPSGRVRVDLDETLEALARSAEHRPAPAPAPEAGTGRTTTSQEGRRREGAGDTPAAHAAAHPAAAAVIEAIRRAPSGGNVQPWRVESGTGEVRLFIDRDKSTTMDVEYRGSHVALGAALFNARTAASAAGALGPVTTFPDPSRPDLVAVLRFGEQSDEHLTRLYEQVGTRVTNRHPGRSRPLPAETRATLEATARGEGAQLRLLEPGPRLRTAAAAMAAADRLRYLTPTLHREMISELVWPGDPAPSGIETLSLGLDPGDLAKLDVVRRPEVMELLAQWDSGEALEDDTRARVATSSALAVVTVRGAAAGDFVQGGSAVEAVWLAAEQAGLAVHPMSPVFLFAVDPHDLAVLSDRFTEALSDGLASFRDAVGLEPGENVALVMRLSHTDATASPSRRRPLLAS